MQEQGIILGVSVLRQRERIAAFAIYATIAVSVLLAMCEALEFGGAIDLEGEPLAPLTLVYAAIGIAYFVIFVGSVIAVAMWIHRAHANLHEAGLPGLQFTPGWAVGWYFVPIMFLFKPYQAMRELWSESHQAPDSYAAPAPGNVGTWWGLWIIGNILGNVSMRLAGAGSEGAARAGALTGLLSTLFTIGAAWLLLGIIREVTAAQSSGIVAAQIFE